MLRVIPNIVDGQFFFFPLCRLLTVRKQGVAWPAAVVQFGCSTVPRSRIRDQPSNTLTLSTPQNSESAATKSARLIFFSESSLCLCLLIPAISGRGGTYRQVRLCSTAVSGPPVVLLSGRPPGIVDGISLRGTVDKLEDRHASGSISGGGGPEADMGHHAVR